MTYPVRTSIDKVKKRGVNWLHGKFCSSGIVCENIKITKKQIQKLFREGKTEGIRFALDKGIINAEKPAEIPTGAPFLSLNFVAGSGK